MKVIGLTGSIGSGKSTVAKILKDKHHAYLILSDEVAKQLMEPGEISYQMIVEYFGKEILSNDKKIDRQRLAAIVFADAEKLKKLNSFTHPYVLQAILKDIERIRESGEYELLVVETALLFQAKYEQFCDAVWVVTAEDSVRRQRLKDSRGYSDEKIDSILAKQMTNDEFRQYTSFVLDNSTDLRNIERQLQIMLECL